MTTAITDVGDQPRDGPPSEGPPPAGGDASASLLDVIRRGINANADVERVRELLNAGARASALRGEVLWELQPKHDLPSRDRTLTAPECKAWDLLSRHLAGEIRAGGISVANDFDPRGGMLTFVWWHFNEWPRLTDDRPDASALENAILPLILRVNDARVTEVFVLEVYRIQSLEVVHALMCDWIQAAIRANAYDSITGFLYRHERDCMDLALPETDIRKFIKHSSIEDFCFLVRKVHVRNIPNVGIWILELLRQRKFKKLRSLCTQISDMMLEDGSTFCDIVNLWEIWDIMLGMPRDSMRRAVCALLIFNEGYEPDDIVGFTDMWLHAVNAEHWEGLKTLTQIAIMSPHICIVDEDTDVTVYDIIMRDGPEEARAILREAYPEATVPVTKDGGTEQGAGAGAGAGVGAGGGGGGTVTGATEGPEQKRARVAS